MYAYARVVFDFPYYIIHFKYKFLHSFWRISWLLETTALCRKQWQFFRMEIFFSEIDRKSADYRLYTAIFAVAKFESTSWKVFLNLVLMWMQFSTTVCPILLISSTLLSEILLGIIKKKYSVYFAIMEYIPRKNLRSSREVVLCGCSRIFMNGASKTQFGYF